ncbi:MAG: DUF354 domain-containing protein [Terriglobia bacterium]
MNIWIDLDNSPHVPFFVPIIQELERRGHSVTLTARDAFQVCGLANFFGLKYKQVGRHYGKYSVLKAYGLCVRALQLFPTGWSPKPDLALSHGSRSQTLAAGIWGIPSLVILDYEFAKRLALFGPTWVMAPEVIPSSAIHHDPRRVLTYPGIKEDVYVPGFRPDPAIKAQLGLNGDSVVITVRPPANEAHYHNPESDELFDAVMDLLGRTPHAKIVLLPRNAKQETSVRAAWAALFSTGKIIVPKHAVDGLNLIWHSDLVISGGGTMNREAAALGVPVYSIFRGRIGAVDQYLADTGRLVLLKNPQDVRTRLILNRRPRPVDPPHAAIDTLTAIVDSVVGVCEIEKGNGNALHPTARGERVAGNGHGQPCRHVNTSQDGHKSKSASLVIADYYRCPINLLRFALTPQSSQQPGYFRLGEDTICYGQLSSGDTVKNPAGNLKDALDGIRIETGDLQLPFDASEVVENLRRERYAAGFRQEGRVLNEIARKAYYLLRPLLGVSARRHLQKIRLRGWNEIRFPAWPVDWTVERIHQKLLALALKAQDLDKIPFIWFWPEGFSSCAIMTHDVENSSGRDFCASLMDLDESFGIRSAFQVVPEKRYPVPKSFLDSIKRRGFEVNVHDLNHDGRLYVDHAEFRRRAERINSYARQYGAQGFRSGALYRNADWYDIFEFSYDMSLPNVAHLDPQRGGCCTVMPYFIGKLVELPVTCTQDYTLFHILGDYSTDLWKRQISLIREKHGLMSFIVHPDYLVAKRARDIYRALLGYLAQLRAEGNIWNPLPRDVASWWRQRSKMELVQENGEWRVEGPGKERARVAYASLAGDEVIYSLTS